MLLFVELMVPEWTGVGVSLMITLVVDTFEGMRAKLALFDLKAWRIDLKVGLTVPGKVVMVFDFVRTIIFQASHILKSTCEGGVILLPTILAL